MEPSRWCARSPQSDPRRERTAASASPRRVASASASRGVSSSPPAAVYQSGGDADTIVSRSLSISRVRIPLQANAPLRFFAFHFLSTGPSERAGERFFRPLPPRASFYPLSASPSSVALSIAGGVYTTACYADGAQRAHDLSRSLTLLP